jgi:NAD(P)-dependent dehydrogenase (short-subunit alcohol dehydrogenase family)
LIGLQHPNWKNTNLEPQDLSKVFDFSKRTIVITGGAGILGGEIACALVAAGANVVILDYEPARADRIKERLDCGPGCAKIIYANVLDRDTLVQAKVAVQSGFGRVDGLINAAGGNHPQATTSSELSFFDLPEEAIRNVIDLNLLGTIYTGQVFGRMMADQGEGSIINISSMNTYRPLTRVPVYAASKAAVGNFTQWLAVHMAQMYSPKIRVNAVAPGFFDTTQNHFRLYAEESGELTSRGQAIIDHTPMARFGSPEDLLGVVFWLLSPASAFVTGAVIPVDGGFSAFSGV